MYKEFGNPYPAKPYKQNALFTGGEKTSLNACVGNNGGPYGLTDYARGYIKAGRRLADSLEQDSLSVDVVVYPLGPYSLKSVVKNKKIHAAISKSF